MLGLLGYPSMDLFMVFPFEHLPSAYDAAVGIWNTKIRIIGVGMMVFGGVWMLFELADPIRRAVTLTLWE